MRQKSKSSADRRLSMLFFPASGLVLGHYYDGSGDSNDLHASDIDMGIALTGDIVYPSISNVQSSIVATDVPHLRLSSEHFYNAIAVISVPTSEDIFHHLSI